MSRRGSRLARGSSAAALVVALIATPALATIYTIDTLADGVAADGHCTLREAIRAAGSDLGVNECPAGEASDAIVLAAIGTYGFSLGEEPIFPGALELRGASGVAASHVVDMGGANRFLRATGAGTFLALRSLTLRRGEARFASPAYGGALFVLSAALTLQNVTIEESAAVRGGGLYAVSTAGGEIRLEGTTFRENLAEGVATGMEAFGGGALIGAGVGSAIVLERVDLIANQALSAAGGARGGGLEIDTDGGVDTTVTIRRLAAFGNRAQGASAVGGGVSLAFPETSSLEFVDSRFENNDVVSSGGFAAGAGLYLQGSALAEGALRRAIWSGNGGVPAADVSQLALELLGTSALIVDSVALVDAPIGGLALGLSGSATALLGQTTVSGNAAHGLRITAASSVPPRIENSILWGNGLAGGSPDLLVVAGSVDADPVANRNWIGGLGVPDPLFVDAAHGDYSLQELSGAIDFGDASFASVGPFDARHAARLVGAELDLGAFERGGLFSDGFESASTAGWSAAVP